MSAYLEVDLDDASRDDRVALTDMSAEDTLLIKHAVSRRKQLVGSARKSCNLSTWQEQYLRWLVSNHNPTFETQSGYKYNDFMNLIVLPMFELFKTRQKARLSGYRRRCILPFSVRVYRLLRCFKNESAVSMATSFFQHPTTCLRDIVKILHLAMDALVSKWVRMPHKDSREYRDLRGQGCFANTRFSNVAYCGDMCTVRAPKPSENEKLYFDGHHGYHGHSFWCATDGHAFFRLIAGAWPGSYRDSTCVEHAKLDKLLKEYGLIIFANIIMNQKLARVFTVSFNTRSFIYFANLLGKCQLATTSCTMEVSVFKTENLAFDSLQSQVVALSLQKSQIAREMNQYALRGPVLRIRFFA
jgi:hypothetical protein